MADWHEEVQVSAQALDDVRVIELAEGTAGPYAGKLFADYGADVVKIEKPGKGDVSRRRGPFPGDVPDTEQSLQFLFLNTNKRSITLDIRKTAGMDILRKMVIDADILILDILPADIESLGLNYEVMSRLNPRLVMVSITPFGHTGPYRDWKSTDLVQYAISSFMNLSGSPDREPLQHALGQAGFMAARNAVVAAMGALLYERSTGEGQFIDVSIVESIGVQPPFQPTQYSYTGVIATRGHEPTLDGAYVRCKGGSYICMTTTGGAPFEDFADLLGLPELLDPKFATAQGRTEHKAELDEIVCRRLNDVDPLELFHNAQKRRFVFGVSQTPKDILDCPQMRARDFFQTIDHPIVGPLKYPGGPFKMSETPAHLTRPAPVLGQHTHEILSGLGYDRNSLLRLTEMEVI